MAGRLAGGALRMVWGRTARMGGAEAERRAVAARKGGGAAVWNEESAWARLAGEPDLWHQRFVGFCTLGAERSLERCYRLHSLMAGRAARPAVPREWRQAAQRWHWEERAQAWDRAEVGRALEPGEMRRLRARRRRLDLIDRLIAQTASALEAAHLDEVEPAQVREMLPTLRQLLRDLLAAERAEYPAHGRALEAGGGGRERAADAPISDEEIARVRAGLAAFHEAKETVRRAPAPPATAPAGEAQAGEVQAGAGSWQPPPLLVCVGPDPALAYDLGMLRAVRQQTGLQFERLINCTMEDLVRTLRRKRAHQHAVRWLHLACHADADGVHFADGTADGEWLSAQLQGIEVLLLAACKGDRVGDWLAVVPYVVTLREEISHGDAGTLAHYFWRALAEGKPPDAALDGALERCAPVVAEFVVRHW